MGAKRTKKTKKSSNQNNLTKQTHEAVTKTKKGLKKTRSESECLILPSKDDLKKQTKKVLPNEENSKLTTNDSDKSITSKNVISPIKCSV